MYYSFLKKTSPPHFFSKADLYFYRLVKDFSYLTGTYCSTTLTDSETQTFLHRYFVDQLNSDSDVIARHNHFYSFWKSDNASYVCSSQVELRTIVVEEWSVTSTFFFRQYVNLCFESSVRSY